jgi:hypothetical protein
MHAQVHRPRKYSLIRAFAHVFTGSRLVAGIWLRWVEVIDVHGGKTVSDTIEFLVHELAFDSLNATNETGKIKSREEALMANMMQACSDMEALSQTDQLITVSNGLAWSFEEQTGAPQRRLLASSSAYRLRVRRLLLVKLTGNTLQSISKRSAPSLLSTTGNLVLKPAELITESGLNAGKLLVASVHSMLAQTLREDNYIFTIMRTCQAVAEASAGMRTAQMMVQLMLTVLQAVVQAGQKYADIMLVTEPPLHFNGSSVGVLLQRKYEWDGAVSIPSPIDRYGFGVELSMALPSPPDRRQAATGGAPSPAEGSIRQASVGIISLWFLDPWLQQEAGIVSDYASGVHVLRSTGQDIFSTTYAGGTAAATDVRRSDEMQASPSSAGHVTHKGHAEAAGHRRARPSGCLSAFGACVQVYMRVNLNKQITAQMLLAERNTIQCKRWNGTGWSPKECSVQNLTYVNASESTKEHVLVHCSCSRDGLFVVARELRNDSRWNHSAMYFARVSRMHNWVVMAVWTASGCCLMLACLVSWVILSRHFFYNRFTKIMHPKGLKSPFFVWAEALQDIEELCLSRGGPAQTKHGEQGKTASKAADVKKWVRVCCSASCMICLIVQFIMALCKPCNSSYQFSQPRIMKFQECLYVMCLFLILCSWAHLVYSSMHTGYRKYAGRGKKGGTGNKCPCDVCFYA